jgi:hypothetical protein
MANDEHVRLLKQGVAAWNAWRHENPFAMFVDLQNKYDWVLKPVIRYPSVDRLIEVLEDTIVGPAEAKSKQLLSAGPSNFL